ncbi:RHS repeat domain-containing protein [Streptomyces sp. HUAS TT20]|uniref:RHS repeat domain-containing protein n=1 Tax=Streptomyces sp. HUAS TT20 TaxID=3447509 RepID=UPI002952A5B4|nr:hypothetical protein [Streptomyces sp. HUAS 15-9]
MNSPVPMSPPDRRPRHPATYDPVGRPLILRSPVGELHFAHDPANRETERRLGTEVRLTQSWSPRNLLTGQSLTFGPEADDADRLLQHRTYTHRADGCLTEIRELTSGTRRFDLDGMGRVTGVRAHGWTETYAYDAAGNVVDASAPAHDTPGEREFDGTLVRSAGATAYEHDAQGRLVRRTRRLLNGQSRTWTYAWNAEDRLAEVVTPDGDRWRYAYDPGRRISKHRVAMDGSEHAFRRRAAVYTAAARITVPPPAMPTVPMWLEEPAACLQYRRLSLLTVMVKWPRLSVGPGALWCPAMSTG